MPHCGDGARFVQLREPLARFVHRPPAHLCSGAAPCGGSKLDFSRRRPARSITDFLGAADTLFISSSRFVEPAQVVKAVAPHSEAGGRHSVRASTGLFPRDGLKSFLRLVQERQGRFGCTGSP